MKASERLLNTENSLVVFKMINEKIGVHFENNVFGNRKEVVLI